MATRNDSYEQLRHAISQLTQLVNDKFSARDEKMAGMFKQVSVQLDNRHDQIQHHISQLTQLNNKTFAARDEKIVNMFKELTEQLETRHKQLQHETSQLTQLINNSFQARDEKLAGMFQQLTNQLQTRHEQLKHSSLQLTQVVRQLFTSRDEMSTRMFNYLTDQLEKMTGSPAVNQKYAHPALMEINRIMAELETKILRRGFGMDAGQLMRNMQNQLDNRAEELKQFQHVVQTTIEREMRQHRLDSGSAEKDSTDPAELHIERLRELYSELKVAFDAKIVAGCMYQHVALTLSETEEIQTSQTMSDAAQRLLNILLKAPREIYEYFLDALRQTDQEHVYKRIKCPDASLKSDHCEVIRKHYLYLVDTIDKHSPLIVHLYGAAVLSLREKEDIEAHVSSTRQNEQLLSVLSRKSAEHWGLFLEALNKSDQPYIRQRLTRLTDLEVKQQEIDDLKQKLEETNLTKERLGKEIKAKQDA